jgi:hypothetical protein
MGQEAYRGSLLSCCLSSVWETYLALCELAGGGSLAFKVGLNVSKSSRVQACLAWRPEGQGDFKEQQGRMRELLKLLATRGFAPILTRDDELAEVSECDAWGIIEAGGPSDSASCCAHWLSRDRA